MEIKKARVLITGGNRGIGRAVAEMCATSGAHLLLANRTSDPALVQTLQSMGAASVEEKSLDLADKTEIEHFVRDLGDQPVDLLFNNSGQLVGGLFEQQKLSAIDQMLEVNFLGLIRLTHGILPGMLQRGRGKIVNNASVSAVLRLPTASTYAASKAAVMAFTECLRLELKGTGVSTLLLLTPGVATRMYHEIPEKHGAHFKGEFGEGISPKIYAQRIREAVLEDLEVLRPSGLDGAMLLLAQHSPRLFEKFVMTKFQR